MELGAGIGVTHLEHVGGFTYVPPSPQVPQEPSQVLAVAGDTVAIVSFIEENDGGSAITGYVVTSYPAGGVDADSGTTALSHNMTGLTNGVDYYFTVVATNAIGNSLDSAPSNVVVPGVAGSSSAFGNFMFGSSHFGG